MNICKKRFEIYANIEIVDELIKPNAINIINNKEQREIYLEVLKSVQLFKRSYVHDFPWTFFRDEIARVIKGNGLVKEEDYLAIPRYPIFLNLRESCPK